MLFAASFPGGNCDPCDQDEVHTALRETEEELGLPADNVNVWAPMTAVPGKVGTRFSLVVYILKPENVLSMFVHKAFSCSKTAM